MLVTPCSWHFFDRNMMCFFSRTTHVHIRLLRHNVLFVVYNNCPGQQNLQISRLWNTYGMLKRELTQSLAQPLPNCDNGWKMLKKNLSQDDIRYLYDRLDARIHACVAAIGGTLCIDVTVWAPLTVTCVSFGLNLLSYTSTMINYLSHHFSIQWTCLEGIAFFR